MRILHPGLSTPWYKDLDSGVLASEFSKFFIDKVQYVKETIDTVLCTVTGSPRPIPLNPQVGTLTILSPVLPSEVEMLIKFAPVRMLTLDVIPMSVLKLFSTDMAVLIAYVTNRSLNSYWFPAVMKKGLVKPLIKKPGLDTADMKNFHPITNLTIVIKIFERLALARLKPHIVKSLPTAICIPCRPFN